MNFRSILAGMLLTFGAVNSASAVTVTVDSHAGPWIPAIQGSPYGIGDNIAPVVVPVIGGSPLTITYISGLTNAFGGVPDADATGHIGFDASANPGASGTDFPSFYADPATYPIFLNALIGAFSDSSGSLVPFSGFVAFAPFAADSTIPFSLVAPVGATALQLGINDDIFGDATGALVIEITGRGVGVPVPGPIAGAGVPGLVLAFGGLFAWWRRLRRRLLLPEMQTS